MFGAVTFHKDVEPILEKSCQECHRAGEIGPMPLLTYQQARPYAKAIKASVLEKRMPPWPADPHSAELRISPAAEAARFFRRMAHGRI